MFVHVVTSVPHVLRICVAVLGDVTVPSRDEESRTSWTRDDQCDTTGVNQCRPQGEFAARCTSACR